MEKHKNKMLKTVKRLISVFLVSVFVFTISSCKSEQNEIDTKENVIVWATEGTRKILQEVDYSSLHDKKTLEIKAFRNEFEAAQIIITPNENIENYSISLADLKNEQGDVLSKDNFQIYHEKYIEVTNVKDGTALTGGGFYPDALVPFENIVNCNENNILEGNNQGVWVELNAPKDQPAGLYSGVFKVQADNHTIDVPVEVTVYDYTLSDTAYAKSCFGAGWNINIMELDASIELQEQYYEFLLDHRITPNTFPGFSFQSWNTSDLIVEKYVDYVEKYYPHPHMTEYNLVYMQNKTTATTYYQGEWQELSVTAPDEAFFKRILDAIVERSLTSGYNLLDKASTYFMFLDEYAEKSDGPYRANYALLAADIFYQETAQKHVLEWSKESEGVYKGLSAEQNIIANALHEKLLNDPMDTKAETTLYTKMMKAGVSGDMEAVKQCFVTLNAEEQEIFDYLFESLTEEKQAIITAILNIYNKITGRSVDDVYAKATFVPYYSIYEGETLREQDAQWMDFWYGEEAEMWWYGCMNPDPPYTTYHIEDELLSARLLGWMMYEYDIVGNLYWATLYLVDGVQDYYDTALRFYDANGDGFLAYPGRPYGVNGAVSSVRLKSILDGNEDYDLLYALEEFYKTRASLKGIEYDESSFKMLMSYLTQNSYDGASCIYDQERTYLNAFANMRGIMAELLEMASNAGVCIEKIEEEGDKVNISLSAPTSAKIYVDGALQTGTQTTLLNDVAINTYDICLTLDQTSNYFDLKVEKDDKIYQTSLYLSGKATTYNMVEVLTLNDFNTRAFGEVEQTSIEDSAAWKISFGTADMNNNVAVMPFIDINVKSLNISNATQAIIIEIYAEDDNFILSIGGSEKGGFEMLKQDVRLKAGWNKLRIETSNKINTLRLTSGVENATVCLGQITVLG